MLDEQIFRGGSSRIPSPLSFAWRTNDTYLKMTTIVSVQKIRDMVPRTSAGAGVELNTLG